MDATLKLPPAYRYVIRQDIYFILLTLVVAVALLNTALVNLPDPVAWAMLTLAAAIIGYPVYFMLTAASERRAADIRTRVIAAVPGLEQAMKALRPEYAEKAENFIASLFEPTHYLRTDWIIRRRQNAAHYGVIERHLKETADLLLNGGDWRVVVRPSLLTLEKDLATAHTMAVRLQQLHDEIFDKLRTAAQGF